MASVEKTEIMKGVTPEQLYTVMTNYESYSDFMDGVDAVEVVEETDDGCVVEYSLNVIKEFTYQLEMTHEKPSRISWTFLDGDIFKKNEGSWEFTDKGDGSTEVTYRLEAGFKMMVPSMITNKLVKTGLPALFESIYQRAKDV